MDIFLTLALVAGIAALVLAVIFAKQVNSEPQGNDKMIEISAAIRSGAMAFLKAEYSWVAVFVVIMAAIIAIFLRDDEGAVRAVAYVAGALLSAGAGFIGMRIATAANARTAEAARTGGVAKALPLAFRGGAVMGFTVAGFGLVGVTLAWIITEDAGIVASMGLGGSSIALFARVGGGIFTKAADVGADLVGKIEAGIPEDDPRNPAVIADNVGDNVGDVAGMGADLFESYVGSLVAPIAFAALVFSGTTFQAEAVIFPIAVAAVGMFASIVGSFLVKPKEGAHLSAALHRGTNGAMVLAAAAVLGVSYIMFGDIEGTRPVGLFIAVVIGLIVGFLIGKISEWYTSEEFAAVKNISKSAETGAATVILAGISEGMKSAAYSVIVVVGGIAGAFWAGEYALGADAGIYGIAIAAIGVLATLGVVIAVDAYGPIADNAGGIAQMAGLPPDVRKATDELDALGNTTAAVAKGFAIASAAVTSLALFSTFLRAAEVPSINVADVTVMIGLFLGAMFPFLFSSMTISAVGRAAFTMIEEVRRQFREIPGLREGKEGVVPDSDKCVEIATKGSLREMVLPASLAIIFPLAIGFYNKEMLGGFLAGSLVTGFLLAIFMSNAGGAWDNAKKFIEAGNHGGKNSDAHHAAVIGDTVGDPFKDTSGPALNIVLKVMSIVALTFASAF